MGVLVLVIGPASPFLATLSTGLEMLRRVRSQPLTKDDLATSSKMQSDTWDLPFVSRISGTISLEVPNTFPHKLLRLGFYWSSLYP
jgi:hypothetical protein